MLKWIFNKFGNETPDCVISWLSNMTAEMKLNCNPLFGVEYKIEVYFIIIIIYYNCKWASTR
jgi:hypothetical protein